MLNKIILVLVAALAFVFVADEALADEDRIIVQVRTTAAPVLHFETIRTVFFNRDGIEIGNIVHPVDPTRDYALGVRVASFVLGPGNDSGTYTGTTSLELGGIPVEGRPWRTRFNHGHPHNDIITVFGITTGAGRPEVNILTILLVPDIAPVLLVSQVSKETTLFADFDGNGIVSPGDLLQHTLSFDASHGLGRGSVLRDVPVPNAPLIPGTVGTSRGVVFRGNLPSDTDVEVRFGPVAQDEMVSVNFLVLVSCIRREIINQGQLTLKLVGNLLEYDLVTDDPSTLEVDDPTVTPVGCGEDEPPKPGSMGPQFFPPVIPQHASGVVIITGEDLGTESGPPLLTINGFTVKTEMLPPEEQKQVVVAFLVPGMTAGAGVIPFTLTPAAPQDPEIPGLVEIQPAAETPQEVAKDYGETVSSQIDHHLEVGLEAFQAARAHAHLDPNSCDPLKTDLVSDLLFENDEGALQIAGSARIAHQQAEAANASQLQLDEITKASDDGVKLLNELMLKMVNKVGGKVNNAKKPGKKQGLICPE